MLERHNSPASEGEEALVEGGTEPSDTPVGVVEGLLVVGSVAVDQVVASSTNNHQQSQDLGPRKHTLQLGYPRDFPAVHPRQETCVQVKNGAIFGCINN